MKSKKIAFMSTLFLIAQVSGLAAASMPEAVKGEYLVKMKDHVRMSSGLNVFADMGYRAEITSARNRLFLVKGEGAAQEIIKNLQKNPSVQYAEPNYIVRATNITNDPKVGSQWGLKNKNGIDVHAESLWRTTVVAKNVVVAVIDTGVNVNHKDLKENIWVNDAEANGQPGIDDDGNGFIDDVHGFHFAYPKKPVGDRHGHGTHCAGIIAARGNNGVGGSGLLWETQIMAVGFLDAEGSGSEADGVKAIDYAVMMGANVISASWGGGGYSQALKDAIDNAGKAGVVFVAAAGNDSSDNDKKPFYPAGYASKNIISVAAISKGGQRASFSNYGAKSVHIAAPGDEILSTFGSSYAYLSGTSMATPFVSAAAAMMLERHPDYSPEKVRQVLMDTSTPLKSLKGKIISGGMLNAEGTL